MGYANILQNQKNWQFSFDIDLLYSVLEIVHVLYCEQRGSFRVLIYDHIISFVYELEYQHLESSYFAHMLASGFLIRFLDSIE